MKPIVTDPVHYYSKDGGACSPPLAAWITEVSVWPDSLLGRGDDTNTEIEGYYNVSLLVGYPCGQGSQREVPYSSTPRPGHWSWVKR